MSDTIDTVRYEVELDTPSFYVEFDGPRGLSEYEILERALEEVERQATIYQYRIAGEK